MAEAEGEAAPREEQQHQLGSSSSGLEDSQPAAGTEPPQELAPAAAAAPTENTEKGEAVGGAAPPETTEERAPTAAVASAESTEERAAAGRGTRSQHGAVSTQSSPDQFKLRKFFVLRPGTLNQAIKDVEALVDKEVDGSIHSIWLMAEVDHWNNEKERLVLITDNSLLVFKYDFVMFNCDQLQRIPLNFVDRISHGTFSFPKHSLLQREGEGVRVFWDRLREPSFTSRWNPFATDFPFITFTYHPVRNINDTFAALCDIHNFREQLKDAAQKVHIMKPVPGKANGVLVLNQQIHIDAYVGLMSFLGNQNKLGYCMARGNIGF
ncbi:tumor protein p63-regulated gene 1-like protein isoform X1 [Lates japonicus]|uniref:Tumor protein p63-regulated gene 1-like protein isoform X1 n=1 Tax=Lates japonicus TaxID=270547 RepID=A0AAD3N5L4_LATJO|nr:tumor protein p63-regulated gene 1-like protein isoform X1 [Lates japonicus]